MAAVAGMAVAVVTSINTRGCNTSGNGVITITPVCTTPGITGATQVCQGLTTASSPMADATAGGTWSSSNTSVATIGTTGIVTGVSAGTTVITYVVGPCYVTKSFTVNPLPTPTTGADTVCAGSTTTLADVDFSGVGVWTSSNLSVGTIGSLSGIVTGITAGTTIITYRLPTSCINTTIVQVDPLPAVITGMDSVCAGLTTTYSDVTVPGAWSSSDGATASIDPVTGIINGVAAGTAVISYTIPTGACYVTRGVRVNPLPAAIVGIRAVCVASAISLTDASTGGLWSSGSTGIATIGSTTGILTGVLAGTTIVTYKLPTGCLIIDTTLVNPLPSVIHGTLAVCVGLTTTLTNDSTGGTWSSSNAAIGSIDAATGIVTGIAGGNINITYTLPTGCISTTSLVVNPLPLPITGSPAVCQTLTTTLNDLPAGGIWSSSNVAVGTIGSSSGIVTGITPGTTIITYTLNTGCIMTTTMLVNPLTPILGTLRICRFGTSSLSSATAGGAWTSGDISVATIDPATGLMTGIGAGTAIITYLLPTGCTAYATATVDPFSNITGATNVCASQNITLADSVSGGIWTSSDITIATVGSLTGVVTGTNAGITPSTATITYTLATGCTSYYVITVNPLQPITGPTEVCKTFTITMANSVAGGTWSSSNIAKATVDPVTGVVTGVSAGTAIITYLLPTGCAVYQPVLVDPYELIVGTPIVCAGLTTTLSNTVVGGTWVSTNTSVATVGSLTGIVTGVAAGTTIISYIMPTGCDPTVVVTVLPLSPITGVFSVCVGLTTSLTDTTLGGTWSSSNAGVGSVISTTGVVTGVSFGTAIITYHLPTGCEAYATVLVSPLAPILGSLSVCEGLTSTLTDATTGGSWSSSDISVATIGSATGIMTGVVAGTATITYLLGTGCASYATVTVNTSPAAITGTDSVCVGLTTTLSDAIGVGTWSSSSIHVSVGSTTGIITGVSAGTSIITYALPGSCISTYIVKVNPLPAAIGGPLAICLSYTGTLTDATAGGTWSSSDVTVVSIGSSTGIATGAAVGTAVITYTLPTGCIITRTETVNPLPAAITGITEVCVFGSTVLSDGTLGGTWTSSNTSIATVTLGTGIVTGASSGTATITYTITSTGCFALTTVTVDPLALIGGPAVVCSLSTITETDAAGGGTWSSGTTAVGTIDATTGVLGGVTVGTTVITYSLATGCSTTRTITVLPIPVVPVGSATVCVGTTATYTDGSGGGTWISSSTAIATIGSLTGILTGVSAGTVTITYKNTTTGCYNTLPVTIFSLAAITGPTSVCIGSCITLADTASGGSWASGSTTVVTIGSGTGVACGILVGTSVISYTLPTGCRATTTITVNPLPFAITGPTQLCVGSNITLTDVTAGVGSTWSSSNTAVATIGATTVGTAVINGVSAGTCTITYTLATGCIATYAITVNPLPAVITGTFSICQGSSTTLSDATGSGTWISSTTSVATIGSTTGVVIGVSGGTSVITYMLTTTGCYITHNVTVNPTPPITGANNVCVGLTTTLSETIGGGTWSSSAGGVASIGSLTGIVTGNTTGTCTITYTFPTGCTSTYAFTVNPNPVPITSSTTTVCQGLTINFTDGTGGGTWSSNNTSVGTIGSTSGIFIGTGGGLDTIKYTLPTGCLITQTVAVNPVTAILGPNNVCFASSITVTDATAGGTWSSSITSVGTIGSTTGIIIGVGVGTTMITYLLPTGCSATSVITVNPPPSPITGPNVVCTGSTILLTDPSGTTTWSSSNTGVATVGAGTGIVTGVGVIGGTCTITFTLATGCYATYQVTVNPSPVAIVGANSVCIGSTTTFTDGTVGGTWSSSNSAIGSVGSATGIVGGISNGTVTISYTMPNGCFVIKTITVNNLPSGISGPTQVCVASTITLTDPSFGGNWSITPVAVATIGAGTGVVTGVSAGTAMATYTIGATTCYATYVITVLAQPSATITPLGDTMICPGGFVALTAPTGTSLTYQWYDGGVAIGGATTSSYITTAGGNYSVLVRAGSTGCSLLSNPMAVTINPATAAVVVPGGLTSGCSSPGITLNGLGAGSYQWERNGVPIVGATAATYVALDTATYTLLVTNSTGCTARDSVLLYIARSPFTTLSLSGPTTFCSNSNLTMTSSLIGAGYTYQWWHTAGAIAGATDNFYTTSTSGTYWVVVSNTGGCSGGSLSVVVTVNPSPSAAISAVGNTTFCSGGSVSLFATAVAGYGYQWYRNGVIIPGAVGTSYVATLSGNYQVSVTNPLTGCNTLTPVPVVVAAVTTPVVVPLTPASFCWGGSAHLSASIVGGAGPVGYQWYYGAATIPGATNSIYNATSAGTYSVMITVPASCLLTSMGISVTENPLPNPLVTFDGVNFNTQNYYVTYQWYENNVMIPGATHYSTPAINNGNYKVDVTDVNGCQSFSNIYILTGFVNRTAVPIIDPADIKVFPNPAQNILHIQSPVALHAIVSDIEGKQVLNQLDAKDLDISNLADGMYILMLYDETNQMVKSSKIVKTSK